MGRVKRIWYLSPMRAAKVQAILCIRAVSPEPPLSLIQAVSQEETSNRKPDPWPLSICHDGMLEDTNSLDAAHIVSGCDRAHNAHFYSAASLK